MFDPEVVATLTDGELEDTLNWARIAEKDYRRRGVFGLYFWWRKAGLQLVMEMSRRYTDQQLAAHEQGVLFALPNDDPDTRGHSRRV